MPRVRLTLDDLPMFASDEEIARAIVGPERAASWLRDDLPVLERKAGFPSKDPVHRGRPVPLVKRFYDQYLHLTAGHSGRPGQAEPFTWTKKVAARA